MKSEYLRVVPIVLLLLLGFAIGGCLENDEGTEHNGDLSGDEDDDEDFSDRDIWPEGTVDDLNGRWGWNFALTYTTLLPIIKREATMLLTGHAISDVEHDGTEFRFNEKICALNMEVVEFAEDFKIFFPQYTIDSVPVKSHTGTLSENAEGADFAVPPSLSMFGLREEDMNDPFNDPLPTEKDDPLVYDMDDDDHVGVTARINTFGVSAEVYVVLRLMRKLDGTLVHGNLLEGFNDSKAEMEVLDADPEGLMMDLDLVKVEDPEVNHFEIVRLPDDFDCEKLLNDTQNLFSYDPHDFVDPLYPSEEEK